MSDLDAKYMTRQELYREACTPREDLDERFINSLTFRIMQDDPERWDTEIDNQVCLNWCVALRTAIHVAWGDYRSAMYIIEQGRLNISIHEAFGRRHTAMQIIRSIAREMYRETVPHEERIM